MKRYILSAIACSLLFASCEKENLFVEQQQGQYKGGFINPEDTAGLVIPEGKALLVFPFNTSRTKAGLNPYVGKSSRISKLRYLVYKKGDDGNFTLVAENNTLAVPESWPYNNDKILTHLVDGGGTYRVVFLGNVDASLFDGEEVLTGVEMNDLYENARIHLPSIEKFGPKEDKLFHWGKSADIEVVTDNSATASIILQRIVTKSSLSTYGIPEGIDLTDNDYSDYSSRFYASLLEPEHELGFYQMIFGTKSLLGEELQEMLRRDIIYPLAYYLGDDLSRDGNVYAWYNSLPDDYWKNYVKKDKGGNSRYTYDAYDSETEVTTALATLKTKINQSYSLSKDDVNKFIEDLYDGVYTSSMLEGIIGNDLVDKEAGGGTKKSVTIAKKMIVEALKQKQKGEKAVLPTWEGFKTMDVSLEGSYPSAIDFDLNVIEPDKTFAETATFDLSEPEPENERQDKSLNIYLLGSMDESKPYYFNLASLKVDYDFPVTGIEGQQLLSPNTLQSYRLVPENITLGEAVSEESCKIIVKYSNLSNQMQDGTNVDPLIKMPLIFSHNLFQINWSVGYEAKWQLDDDSGKLLGNQTLIDQVYLLFRVPDFSSDNLKAQSIGWKVVNEN